MWVRLLTIVGMFLGSTLLLCKLPSPPPGPENAFVALEFKSSSEKITKDALTDSTGKQINICMIHNLTQYIDSSVLKITKGTDYNKVHQIRSFKEQLDTTSYPIVFSAPGIYTVIFVGYIQGQQPTILNGSITVLGSQQNQKPTLNVSKAIKTQTGQELQLPVSATDPDANQQVTISVVQKPESATFVANQFKWTPAITDTGSFTVIFTATDNGSPALSTTDSCVIVVERQQITPNQKPVINLTKAIKTGVGQELTIPVSATDPDANQLVTISVMQKPESATFVANQFKWTPANTDTGSFTVIFTATDDGSPALSTTDTCVITVSSTPVNRAPMWNTATIKRSSLSEVLVSLDLSSYCIDPDNDILTMSLLQQAPATDTVIGKVYQFTPSVSDTGVHLISIVATDPAGLSATVTLELTISSGIVGKQDKVPPVITFKSPSKDTVISVDSCEVKLICVDDSGCSVKGYCDGIAFDIKQITSVANLWTGIVKGLKAGTNSVIKIVATDSSSAKNTDSASVHVLWSKKAAFTLTVNAASGSVTKSPDAAAYDSGTVVTLTPVPANNYHFTGWSGDLTGSTNPATITMTSAKTVTAGFEVNPPSTFALTVVAANGTVKKNPDLMMYDSGKTVGLKATPETGYHFVKWTGDASGDADSITVQMTATKKLTANFEINSYELTVSPGTGGSITVPVNSPAVVNHSAATAITAVANTGYNFSGWTVSGPAKVADSSMPNTTVTLTGNAKVTANFTQKTYSLTVTPQTGGSISAPKSSPVTVNHGAATTITAAANTGYNFSGWTVSGDATVADSTLANTTITLTGNATVTAKFTQKTYSLTVTPQTGGSISAPKSSPVTVAEGAATAITAVPNSGYGFSGWTVSGDATVANPTSATTTVSLTGDAKVVANFTQNTYSLTVTPQTGGSISAPTSSPVTVAHGAATAITAAPNSGYSFSGWTVSGSSATVANSTSANTTVTLTGDATVTANFKPNLVAPTNATGTSPICPGSTSVLTADAPLIGTLHWYSSACGTGAVGTGPSVTTAALTSDATFYVRAELGTNYGPCATVSVKTSTQSTAATSINATNANPCPGTSVTLSVSGGSLGTGATWKWYTNSACTQAASGTALQSNGSQFEITPSLTATYYVRAEGTCNKTTPANRTITVQDVSEPPTEIYAVKSSFCNGDSITLSVVNGTLGSNATWKWYTNSGCTTPALGRILVSNGSQIKVGPTSTTTYYVRAEGGCNPTTPKNIKLTNLSPTITKQPVSASSNCQNTMIQFSVEAIGSSADDVLSYQWVKDNTILYDAAGMMGGVTTPTIQFFGVEDFAGKYYCIISNSNCSISTNEVTFTYIGDLQCP